MQYTSDVLTTRPVYKSNLYDFVDNIIYVLGGKEAASKWLHNKLIEKKQRERSDLNLFELQLMAGTLKD